MAQEQARSYVFATDFRVPDPRRVWPLLTRHTENLVDLGARYAFGYESVLEAGRVLVVIGVRTEQPLLSLLRSRRVLDWFEAVGVDDIPAVFAGRTVDRIEVSDISPRRSADVVVVAITCVDDPSSFRSLVHNSIAGFAKAGIKKTLVYQAFDNPCELMFLQQLESEDRARIWAERSDIADEWLAAAGVGAYPPVFVGQLAHAMGLDAEAGSGAT
jgi:hypothetical protein